jgi:ssDNA-binding Zn-finger/Zn-ribbon topoisomerase 1
MEQQLNIGGGEFCACTDTPKTEFILRRGETDTVTNAVADTCEKCGKPIEKQTIIIDFVKAAQPDFMSDAEYAAAYGEE